MANIQITLDDEFYNIPIDDNPALAQGATFKPYTKQLADNKIEIGYTNDFGLANPEPVTLEFPQLSDADRTSYNGQLYDTIGERIDADIQDLQNKIDSVSYEGTTIHADNTAARNLTVNGNKVEILGQTIQNCLDHINDGTIANRSSGIVISDGIISITTSTNAKGIFFKKASAVIKPDTKYTFIIDVIENTVQDSGIYCGFEDYISENTFFKGGEAIPTTEFKGIIKKVFMSRSDLSSALYSTGFLVLSTVSSGSIKFRYAIVEGDWTEKDISWVPFGLNYPESTEIVQCGKNLINADDYYGNYKQGDEYVAPEVNSIRIPLSEFIGKQMMFSVTGKKSGNVNEHYLRAIINGVITASTDGFDSSEYKTMSLMFTPQTENDYCHITYGSGLGTITFKDVMLAITDTEIPYEPYSGSNVNIDYHLRSINDEIRDRIYTLNRKVYYEQNVKEIVFDGSDDENWVKQVGIDDNVFSITIGSATTLQNRHSICDKIPSYNGINPQNVDCKSCGFNPIPIYSNYFYIKAVDEFNLSLDELRQYLLTNPIKVLYQLETPIVTEIAIEDFQSFAEQTNWFTTNTVKPYLKASIPSGIDASEAMHEILEARVSYDGLTFDSLDERLDYDFNEIRGKVDVANYKGTTIHANNTYARNLVTNRNKIEVLGQTIQNCLDHSNEDKFDVLKGTIDNDGYINMVGDGTNKSCAVKLINGVVKPNTKYTFVIEIKENSLVGEGGFLGFEYPASSKTYFNGTVSISPITSKLGVYKYMIDTKTEFTSDLLYASALMINNKCTSGSIKFRYAVVEGDWTNKEVSFVPFGLNYPETTEIVERGKNLFDGNVEFGSISSGTGELVDSITTIRSINYTLIDSSKSYKLTDLSDIQVQIFYYDVNKNYLNDYDTITTNKTIKPPISASYCKLKFYKQGITLDDVSNVQLEISTTITEYEPYTERTVNINYPLASVSDSIRDRYYVKDGKKYHKQNVKEIVFDGSDDENWKMEESTIETGKNIRFYIDIPNGINSSSRERVLCNRFYYILSGFYALGCFVYNSKFYCYTTGSDIVAINVNSVDEFKQWLSSNIVNTIYELATPITTEIETEDLQSFEGQTNLTTTNVVKPTLDIDIPSNLNAVVSSLMVENSSLQAKNQALSSELENQKSSIETQQANVDYISMMTGVDL